MFLSVYTRNCEVEIVDINLFSEVDCTFAFWRVRKERKCMGFCDQMDYFLGVSPHFTLTMVVLADVEEF